LRRFAEEFSLDPQQAAAVLPKKPDHILNARQTPQDATENHSPWTKANHATPHWNAIHAHTDTLKGM